MAKVEVELKKLYQILVDSEFFYQVPDYQRPYVWDKDHLGALIDDLVGSYTNNREDEYFCGSIVIAENQKDKRLGCCGWPTALNEFYHSGLHDFKAL
ncbi:hypothetical protein BTM233_14710 [Helicobacter pylori]